MEGAESESPTQQEDRLSNSEIYSKIAGMIEGEVKDILDEIEEDENYSELTAESYDYKKSYLRRHLTGLSRLHKLLAIQHARLIREVKETKTPELSLKKNPNVVDEPVSDKKLPGDETTTLKQKSQETEKSHLELQKQVADLKLMISVSDLRIKTMEEELDRSSKSLRVAKDTISYMKGDQYNKVFQQNQTLKHELQSTKELLGVARKQFKTTMENFQKLLNDVEAFEAEKSVRDDKIKKLNTANDLYKSEISELEERLKSKEHTWSNDVARLKGQLKDQTKLVDNLKKQFNGVKIDKNRISVDLQTLKDERCSQEKLIKELETRLNTLRVEHEGVVSSFDNTEKLNNELTLKVVELEKEVDRQREVISVTEEEKKEAIRQLSFALEHYMSKYKQLRHSSVANNTGCFGFQSCLNTL